MSDAVIERLNLWGDHCARIGWPLLWQSSLLIVGLFIADIFLRRKIRPSVRQALWFVVLVKLLLPPSFAIPTGIGWWLRPREVAPAKPQPASYIVTYGSFHAPRSSRPEEAPSSVIPVLPSVRLSARASALLASAAISATLLIVMLVRWRHLRRQLRLSESPPIWLQEIAGDARGRAPCRTPVRLSLTDATISPALCGLFRPVILLPKALVKKLTPPQLRAVLLHELFHLRNGDVWINCFQSLLQIVFWWHPFLWLANARIRRIREEVVDDSVRLALAEEAETYAPTLLEVARLALARPLATLGLVGILESRHALKQRVDRLVNFPAPRRVGLSTISAVAILAFASVALPMGQAPPKNVTPIRRQPTTIYNADQKLYYTFDQKFLDYFDSNGVDALNHAPAQNSDVSNPSQSDAKALGFDYTLFTVRLIKNGSTATNSSERLLDSRGLDMLAGFPNSPGSENAIFGEPGFGAVAGTALGFQPLTDEFNVATGIATATKRTFLSCGDASLSADSITVNRETGEIVAEGSVQLKMRDVPGIPLGGRFHGNITNQLFAQNQPSVLGSSRTPQAASGKRRIMNKLEAIRLNHVAFDNLPLSEVVNYLQAEAKRRDPEGKGINFILNPNADLAGAAGPPAIDPATGLQVTPPQVEPADINGVAIRISPPLEDVRMLDVLDAITKVADKRIRYSIGDYGVTFRLAGKEPVLFTRVYDVDPNVFAQGLESVVGFSVGNFQTGGQGGGGQGNSSGVAVPRVQVAPNGIGGQGGAQGSAGGISGGTRPRTMTNHQAATQQAVRQLFANAGVDLSPPKSVFFNDKEGKLLVHGTLNDFDIIEKSVMALNAFPDFDSASPARPTTASVGNSPVVGKALTRTVEVAAAISPQQIPNANPANTEKLRTEIMLVDPRTFSEWVKKTARLADDVSPQETMDAFRKILMDRGLQLAPPANIIYNERNGNLFVRAIPPEMDAIKQIVQELNRSSAQIRAQANPPKPDPATNQAKSPAGAAERSNQTANNKLLTRTIKLDLNNFFAGIQREANLTGQPSLTELQSTFGKLLNDAGVRPLPSEVIRFDDRNGTLFVQATRENMEAIVNKVQALSVPPTQIVITAKFIETTEGNTEGFLSWLRNFRVQNPVNSARNISSANPSNSIVEIISDAEFRGILDMAKQHDDTDLLSEASVTTLSGRQAQIQMGNKQSVVTLNPKARVSPGVTSSNFYSTEPLWVGPVLDVTPIVADDGVTVSLNIFAQVTELLDYDSPPKGEEVPVYVDGQVQSVKPTHPRITVRDITTGATLIDGQTVMLGKPTVFIHTFDKDGKELAEPGTEKKELLVFVTATIIDPAGNPIHNPP